MLKHLRWVRHGGVFAAMAVLMVLIAWGDAVLEQAVAVSALYTLVILLALRYLSVRSVIVVAVISLFLTLSSAVWTSSTASQAGWINTGISMLAIAVTAYLGSRMKVAQSAAHAAQARLVQLTRAGNVGALGASIAHEVNQPLAAIVTSGNACQRWLAQQPPQMERAYLALQRMQQEAVRASNVISRVRGMAKGEAPQLERVHLAGLVQDMVQLMGHSLGQYDACVVWSVPADLPDVWADRLQLQQVLGNLLLNAGDAVDAAMECAGAAAAKPVITVKAFLIPHEQVQLTVTDTGTGLAPAVIGHVFDAFWSTKSQGMGLGLSLCRTMVEAMGGQVWAENRQDGCSGAHFHVTLPVAPAPDHAS